MPRAIILLLTGVSFLLTSCFKELAEDLEDIESLKWNPTLAVPLANGSFTIAEFAEDLSGDNFSTTTREDGLVVFNYSQDQVFSEYAENLVEIQDENYTSSINIPSTSLPDLAVNGTVTTENTHEFGLNTSFNDKLYNASLKGGTLEIDLAGNFPASGELTFTFNGLTDEQGSTLTTTFQWTYDGTNTQSFQRSINLDGLDIDLTDNGTTYNYFYFTSSLTLNYEGQTVTSNEKFDMNLDLIGMEFSKALATIGRRTIVTESNLITLNFAEELKGGLYYFDEPAFKFNFKNSFGIPVDAVLVEAIANSNTKGSVSMIGEAVNNPFSLQYPSESEMGTIVETDISIDHQNSNLPVLIAWQADEIAYTFEGIVNANDNNDVHFVLDTSRIVADIDLELPMIGRFRNLRFSETYDFSGSDLEEAEYALFKLSSSNGFPISAKLQLYFLDNSTNLIDSLIYEDQQVLEAGEVDTNGKVIQATEKDIDVMVPRDRLVDIAAASRLVFRAILDTPENDVRSVRIYEDDRLDVKIYIQTEFEIIL